MNETGTLEAQSAREAIHERIEAARRKLGKRLVILGHHYQVDEVIRYADFTGDSFKLAQLAAEQTEADYVVFCGVHFMAESADVLTTDRQQVILPDLAAGCSMADMANADQVETAWEHLEGLGSDLVPVTYMNSSAAIKAFCGRHGGIVCTSSNAEKVLRWALEGGRRMLFLPDQHLGRNCAHSMGYPLDEMAVWDPHALAAENLANGCDRARIILWKGHCSVHTKFLPEHVDQVRARIPGVKVISHPECVFEVVQKSDLWGSTERIIREISASPPGSAWAVGTEFNLVARLGKRFSDRTVVSLSGINCLCSTMYRISPEQLAKVLEGLVEGEVINQISVDPETSRDAKIALDRMLAMVA